MKISPSTMKRAKCRRRVVAEKWGEYSEPFGKAASFGTAVHAVGEAWMKSESDPNPSLEADRLFLEILPYVPSRELDAERYLKLVADGVEFHGYIDFGGWAQNPDTGMWELVYGDYKTSSKPWEYGLSDAQDFWKDEQVNIYGLAEMIDYGSNTARPFWLYADTSKKRFAYTQGGWKMDPLTYMQAEDYMADVALPLARSIISDFAAANSVGDGKTLDHETKLLVINSVPCNPEECDYRMRNCGFRKHCDLLADITLVETEQKMADESVDEVKKLIEARKARKAAASAASGDVTPDAVKEAVTPAEPRALPPEAKEALAAAVEQRDLPPNEQDLGRKAKEKQEAAEVKATKEADKEAKKAAKETKKSPPGELKTLVDALKEALGAPQAEVWVKL